MFQHCALSSYALTCALLRTTPTLLYSLWRSTSGGEPGTRYYYHYYYYVLMLMLCLLCISLLLLILLYIYIYIYYHYYYYYYHISLSLYIYIYTYTLIHTYIHTYITRCCWPSTCWRGCCRPTPPRTTSSRCATPWHSGISRILFYYSNHIPCSSNVCLCFVYLFSDSSNRGMSKQYPLTVFLESPRRASRRAS